MLNCGVRLDIKSKREATGMTQTEFAKRIFTSPQNVNNWERGYSVPRALDLPMIAEALGCTIDDLYCIIPDGAKEVS